jgi:hypothetical protein
MRLVFAVWSTPRNPGVHAKQVMRFVAMHADHAEKENPS